MYNSMLMRRDSSRASDAPGACVRDGCRRRRRDLPRRMGKRRPRIKPVSFSARCRHPRRHRATHEDPHAMRIGIPSETKTLEGRVALVPAACADLVRRGHEVYIQSGAGQKSGFKDEEYTRVGVHVVADAAALYAAAELIVKVKEPIAGDLTLLQKQHLLFCYLHLAPEPELTQAPAGDRPDRRRLRVGRGGRWRPAAAGADVDHRRPHRDADRHAICCTSRPAARASCWAVCLPPSAARWWCSARARRAAIPRRWLRPAAPTWWCSTSARIVSRR